ncbi:MAG TPA: ATP-binding protein [Terriglobia bacterium]|nr:ATP-binding protein [Terriglobia bacterium]
MSPTNTSQDRLSDEHGQDAAGDSGIQRALLNILEDFDAEKERLKGVERATLNILDDFDSERVISDQSQRALLNILDDMDTEKSKIAEANQQLEAVNRELENATLAKDRFLASMSHELRTPMNAIIGFSGMLLMKLSGPLNPDQEKQLRTIQTSAKHLLSLINDLLDLAKIESGKVELHLERVDCQKIIDEVAITLAPLADSKGIQLEINKAQEDIILHTDRRALTQIVLNLANNAIKFTERGFVRLDLRRGTNGRPFVEISVADSGMGIPPEGQARLFKAFEQVHNSSSHWQEGTGLGLYLSQKLSALLGGKIKFESQFGMGSKFTVSIPE